MTREKGLSGISKVLKLQRLRQETDGAPAEAPGAELTHRAFLAARKADLLAPVNDIREIADTMCQDVEERGHQQLLADLQRIQRSTDKYQALIEDLLNPDRPDFQDDELKRTRHDLCGALSDIIGYCELWIEDVPELLLECFFPDLKRIHDHGRGLKSRLDELLDTSKEKSNPEFDLRQGPEADMIRVAVDSIPGRSRCGSGVHPARKSAVLVADDNDIERDILRRLLGRQGHTATVVPDGKTALELLRAQPFDLLLLDIIMPGLNGLQVLEQVKKDENLCHLPVIMISAMEELDWVVRCIEMGAEDYLTKPVNSVLLNARVDASLEKKRLLEAIRKERQRSDELLHVILPREIAEEMKATQNVKARRLENVAVLFADVVGFTPYCSEHEPEQVVLYLNQLVEIWEEVASRHQVEKIKTIGDAFMGAAGLLRQTTEDPLLCCLRCGLEMIEATQRLPPGWNLRVGVHAGPVVAGVMGKRQYLFDLWGETVNTAARMESHGVPGSVVFSRHAWQRLASPCHGESLGSVWIKGMGNLEMIQFTGFVPSEQRSHLFRPNTTRNITMTSGLPCAPD